MSAYPDLRAFLATLEKQPNLSSNLLNPAGQPQGMVHKMIIDATTPVAPDDRGDYGMELDTPHGTDAWRTRLSAMIKDLR